MSESLIDFLMSGPKNTKCGQAYLSIVLRNNNVSITQMITNDAIFKSLRRFFFELFGQKLSQIVLSGSLVKGTAIEGTSDLDIVLIFKADAFITIDEMYKDVINLLKQSFGKVREQNVSIGITIEKKEIDIVPAKRQKALGNLLSLRSNATKSYIETNIIKHIEIVEKSPHKEVIRAFKIWNNQNKFGLNSFLIEMMVIQILKPISFLNLEKKITKILEFIANGITSQSIIDPTKPSNILNNEIDTVLESKMRMAALTALQDKNWKGFIK